MEDLWICSLFSFIRNMKTLKHTKNIIRRHFGWDEGSDFSPNDEISFGIS